MPNINRRTQIGQLLSLLADDLLSMGVSMTSETPFFCLTGNERLTPTDAIKETNPPVSALFYPSFILYL